MFSQGYGKEPLAKSVWNWRRRDVCWRENACSESLPRGGWCLQRSRFTQGCYFTWRLYLSEFYSALMSNWHRILTSSLFTLQYSSLFRPTLNFCQLQYWTFLCLKKKNGLKLLQNLLMKLGKTQVNELCCQLNHQQMSLTSSFYSVGDKFSISFKSFSSFKDNMRQTMNHRIWNTVFNVENYLQFEPLEKYSVS